MKSPINRRGAMAALSAFGASSWLSQAFANTAFPNPSSPVKFIVPSPPGSTTDGIARVYANALGDALRTTVIVDNRAGGQGVIGIQAAKNAPPDGYTVLFTSLSTQVLNPHLFKKLPYDPINDFIPVSGTMKASLILNVGPSLAHVKTAAEFSNLAKASPGKYTVASMSAMTRLGGDLFAKTAGLDLLQVTYKNISDLTADLLSGRVDMFIADLPVIRPFYQRGVRPLAVASPRRLAAFPDVATFSEQGMPGLDITGWSAAFVPARTPASVVEKLREGLIVAQRSQGVQDYFKTFGSESLELSGGELAVYQKEELAKWGKAIKDANLAGTL